MLRNVIIILIALIALVIFLETGISGPKIPEGEMPLGVFTTYSQEEVDGGMLDSLHDELGFNFAMISACPWSGCEPVGESRVRFYYNHGILPVFKPIKTGDDDIDTTYLKYERSRYVKIEAEDSTSIVCFLNREGSSSNGWFTPVYPAPDTPYVVLDDLWYVTDRTPWWDNYIIIDYQPVMRIWADVDYADLDDTVAVLKIFSNYGAGDYSWDTLSSYRHLDTFYTSAIVVDTSLVNDTTEWEFDPTYNFPDNASQVTFQLISYSNFEFKVDWFKVYDEYGKECVEDSLYDNIFADYVRQSWCDSLVMNWYLRDEPKFDQLAPFAHIDSVIRLATASEFGDTTYGITSLIGGWWLSDRRVKNFVDFDNPQVIWCNKYPFKNFVDYTGTHDSGGRKGLQIALKDVARSDSAMRAIADSYSIDWWRSVQTWYYVEDDTLIWRWPTQSELSCQTFMSMCNNVKGIACYPYLGSANEGATIRHGIRYGADSSYAPSHLWDALHDRINPYIKAIDSVYLDLTWDTAYYVQPRTSFPTSDLIDTIYAKLNYGSGRDITTPPDNGWFHVGEFYDDGDTLYFMLVNRSCSWDFDDPSEAPSVTAFVRLKPEAIGSDYAYIIDIAKEVKLDSLETDTTWVGITDTTYSAKLSSTIPFTTVLSAGEGRLFKIVAAEQKNPDN